MRRRNLLKALGTGAMVTLGTMNAMAMETDGPDGGDSRALPTSCDAYTVCSSCLDDPNCGRFECRKLCK